MSEEIEQLRKENDVLRALLPALKAPCVYCGLTDISKCRSGFPGCAQADDMMCGDDAVLSRLLHENRALKKSCLLWQSSGTPPNNTLVFGRHDEHSPPFVAFHMSDGNFFRDHRQCDNPDDIPSIVRPREWALMNIQQNQNPQRI